MLITAQFGSVRMKTATGHVGPRSATRSSVEAALAAVSVRFMEHSPILSSLMLRQGLAMIESTILAAAGPSMIPGPS